MRVLIINPPWPGKGYGTRSQNRIIKHRSDKYLQYPIFLAYSAAQLEALGHEVAYIDSVVQDLDLEQTLTGCLTTVMNIIWILIGGIWIAVTHFIFAILCAITIIGIPFARQHMKLSALALMPFGKEVVQAGNF
jgi:uncharacterized membrane protein YccF (DUF307 family)